MYEFSTILNTIFQPLHTHVSNIQNFWKITFFPRDNRCTGKNATSNTIGERERCSPSVSLYSCPTKVCRCGGQHRFFPKVISRNTTLRNDEEYLSIRDAHLIAFLHCSPKPLTLDRSAKILWRKKKKKGNNTRMYGISQRRKISRAIFFRYEIAKNIVGR